MTARSAAAEETHESETKPSGKKSFWLIDLDNNYQPTLVRDPVAEGKAGERYSFTGRYMAAAKQVLTDENGKRYLGQKASVTVPAEILDIQHDKWEDDSKCMEALKAECARLGGGAVEFVTKGYLAGKI